MMNTWTMENLSVTNNEERTIALIERIKSNAERKGIYDYAMRELDLCETYADLKKLSQDIWDYFPPSERQVELACRLADELGLQHPVVNENHDMNWFSKYISKAIEVTNTLPMTEKQGEIVQAMQWCPDIPKITAEEKANRKNASEYINKHNAVFVLWKKTRLNDTTKRTLKNLYRKVEGQEVSDNFLMQYDEDTAQKMIAHLKNLQKELADFRAEKEIEDEFRQLFINFDNNERVEKAKNK